MTRATLLLGPLIAMLGGLWVLQGLGLVHLQPILCLADCAPLQGPSRVWASIGAIAFVGGSYATALAFGAWRWSVATGRLVAQLRAARVNPAIGRYDVAELVGLPAPVARYFRAVLTDGQRIVTAVTLTQRGRFNLSATADQWRPFTATQHFTTARAGFVWDARIAMVPGVPIRVVDALVAGEGLLRPAVLGLYGLGTMRGTGEIARGELLRHFAESVWFPTALLPSQGVVWQAVDAMSATATLSDGALSVTMLVRFGADGLVSSVHVDGRATTVAKATVLLPWECRLSNYQRRGGMQVPLTGEALYLTPQGERSYFKGTIDSLIHEFAP